METSDIIMIILIVICVMLSAFFSSVETAFSCVNTVRLQHYADKGNKKAKTALYITNNYDKALTTILIGNNIVNIGCSSIATVVCMNLFGSYGAAISTGAITLLVLTFGEVIPKCLAKEHAEKLCLFTGKILRVLMTVLTPLVFLFIKLKELALKLFDKDGETPSVTEDELKVILENSREEGVLEQQEKEMVQSALEFDETTAEEILTPRVDLTAIDLNDGDEYNKAIILQQRFSRIPVYRDSIDNVVGILHTRDYLEAIVRHETPTVISLMQAPYFIYKTKKLSAVLSEFKHNKLHIAVVADDYGGTLGIVTMEDLIEEIVGDIWDEDEVAEPEYQKLAENSYNISGDMNISDMLALFDLKEDFVESDTVSVGGLIMENLGDIPCVGDTFTYANVLQMTVLEIDDQRVTRVRVDFTPPEQDEEF